MKHVFALLAAGAALQLSVPAQAAGPVMLQLCSGGAPVPLPMKEKNAPGCKICHSAMRKRAGSSHCCGDEEDSPDAA